MLPQRLNSETFGPNELDNTFGPQVLYVSAPKGAPVNPPPSAGLQLFGQVEIVGEIEGMTVTFRDLEGKARLAQDIEQVL